MRRRGTVRKLGTEYDGGGTVDTVEGYGGYGWRGAVDSVEGYGVGPTVVFANNFDSCNRCTSTIS